MCGGEEAVFIFSPFIILHIVVFYKNPFYKAQISKYHAEAHFHDTCEES